MQFPTNRSLVWNRTNRDFPFINLKSVLQPYVDLLLFPPLQILYFRLSSPPPPLISGHRHHFKMSDSGQERYCQAVVSGTGDSEDAEIAEIHKTLARFVVSAGLQFDMVESPFFINFVYSLCPKFELPSAPSMSKLCYQIYLDEKLKLQNFMKNNCQSVCLSIDAWNSPQHITYMAITGHFIDEDWKLQRKLLSFLPNDFCSDWETGDLIEDCLVEWGIKKVCTITMESTSSNDDTIVYLKDTLIKMGIEFSGCKYFQMKCIVRLINSVVVEVLEKAKLLVNRVRDAVDYVKYCPSRIRRFKKCVEDEKIEGADRLLSDLTHLWNFTYVMVSRAEKYEKAFDRYAEQVPKFKRAIEDGWLSSLDWSVVRRLTVVLKPFYNIMFNISKSSNLTSNNFWADISDLYAIFSEWQNGDDLELQAIAEEMRSTLEEYFGGYEKMNKIVYIASVLDPRWKFEVLEYSFSQIYGEEKGRALFKDVKEAMFELFNKYKSMLQHQAVVVDQSNSGSSGPTEERKNIFMALYKKLKLETDGEKTKLDAYLNKPTEDDKDGFDILEWWKCNSEKFPILSHMARDILAIPKSSVRPNFTFNIEERMLEEFKGDWDYEVLQAMMCGQDWLPGSPLEENSFEQFEEDDIVDEELMEAGELGPSWEEGSDGD